MMTLPNRTAEPDVTEFERLYRTHACSLLAQVRGWAGTRHAEDVTAEVWRRAAVALDASPDMVITRGWLTTVARNLVIDAWRRERRWLLRLETHHRDLAGPPTTDPQDALDEVDETAGRIWQALDELAPHHRMVLVLYYVDGLRTRAIAESLGKSEDAVESLIRRAREKLAEAYARLAV